jgi:putative heme iron utilization protein
VSGPFSPEVVDAVRRHMDADHKDDSLLIVRSLGGIPDATTATMSGFDESGALFVAGTADGERTVRVPWSAPIEERAQIRAEVVRMYHEACEALGVEPRAASEH